MTCLEWISLIIIVMICIKLIVVWMNPVSWKSVVNSVYARTAVTKTVGIILAAVILRCLLQELTIVQIFASMALMMALMMIQFAGYGREMIELSEKLLNDRSWIKKVWLSLVLWIGLMIWVLYDIFV
ncbi:MAG: hypothetical protein KC733_02375 [Candidatus Omnitrophica bacterium]|nr:hypothetical protein [Candidatus Omnitrophota bacterium]